MLSGNKGEWSEIYLLFKLLGDKMLYLGDENLEKIHSLFFPILKVLRTEKEGDFEYSIKDHLILISGAEEPIKISIDEFKKQSVILLEHIKNHGKGSFSIPETEAFMRSINCFSLKAGSSQKTDIMIIIHDEKTGQTPALGFSIKSQLGSASTLLNSGKTTNFIYKITNCALDDATIEHINNIDTRSKIRDRISYIHGLGAALEFADTEQPIFFNNLCLVDSALPQILSLIIAEYYSSDLCTVADLVTNMETNNPLDFNIAHGHRFYSYKMKRFLTDVALGMMSAKTWTGQYDATGGYLIVKKSGDIVCYHLYQRNNFENYLLNNVKLDTASSSRYDFGTVYKKNAELFIKLNLQIRFLK